MDMKLFYENMAGMNAGDPDYAGLHQGIEGTTARHGAVLNFMGGYLNDAVIADFGCGTGLLLDSITGQGYKPKGYIGVDMVDHSVVVNGRIEANNMEGMFILKPDENVRFVDVLNTEPHPPIDVIVMCGVVGYQRFQSLTEITQVLNDFRSRAQHGIITIPKVRPDCLSEDGFYRHHEDDVYDWFTNKGFAVSDLYTDMVVYW